MATKLLAVIATILLASCTAEECSHYQDNCSPDPNFCQIECKIEGEDCVPTAGTAPGECPTYDAAGGNPAPKYEDMTAQKCEETCSDATASGACAFYRFEKIHDEIVCYLMNNDQCKEPGFSCTGDDCKSDAMDCDSGEDWHVPPEGYTCPSGTKNEAGSGVIPDYKLFWDCRDLNGMVDFDLEQDSLQAPGNTECTTRPGCSKNGVEEVYKYKCMDDNANPDPSKGKWEWQDTSSGSDPDPDLVDANNGGKLKVAKCNADSLTVENYGQQMKHGMEILCVDEQISPGGEVPAQNSCILICDGYNILNFYTKMAKWVYRMFDEPAGETDVPDSNGSVIFCHH